MNINDYNTRDYIIIKGARVHNLKNIDVVIPRKKLVVMTGVSGSGKSSLAIDTLFAEGQRRYVESLSSYARQFLSRMDKPDVDYIKGISPAIAIDQKVSTRSSRSTVGTLTEIYDYLRLLFARIGKTYSPVSGNVVKKHSISDVCDAIAAQAEGTRLLIATTLIKRKATWKEELQLLQQKGFSRVLIADEMLSIEQAVERTATADTSEILLLIDRLAAAGDDEETQNRAADSVQTAFQEGEGVCYIIDADSRKHSIFSNIFEADGLRFEEPSDAFFNFNTPQGACRRCEGFGSVIGYDENLIIPNRNLSVYEDAIAPWKGEKMGEWKEELIQKAALFDFPIHRPIRQLTPEQYRLLWTGNRHFEGLNAFFEMLESNAYKVHYRIMMARYRGRTECPECQGTRLRKETQYVKIQQKNLSDLVLMPIGELLNFFDNLSLNEHDGQVAGRLLTEIRQRLRLIEQVGLSYLTLNRLSSTLSGGETQRLHLTRSLGSNLSSSLYLLDEPSVGLHPRDTENLVRVLKNLRDLGNTVLVVEHEEAIIRAADYMIDIGPAAGHLGGEVVFVGDFKALQRARHSLTADYINGKRSITTPTLRRSFSNRIYIKNATLHNLKDISVTIPLQAMTVLTGVSGSGKSTLAKKILAPALQNYLNGEADKNSNLANVEGDAKQISQVEMIDQNPLGRSSRSNPVTYTKAYDTIRDLFCHQKLAQVRGYKPKHFSFNVEGGRCETCKGEGEVVVEMQFLADVHLTCEDCKGKRFKEEVLEIKWNDKNISEVLDMSIAEALEFFASEATIAKALRPLYDVGLEYVRLGQSSSTLSGGEAQRVKLAYFLGKGKSQSPILFLFDEPTTGLHFHDIHKLMAAFNALVEQGHTLLIIEHNLDIIKSADWVIDLGPEGGEAGGYLLYEGTPEGLLSVKNSYTAHYLAEKLQATS